MLFFFLVTGEDPPSPTAVDDTCKGVGRMLFPIERVVDCKAVVDVGTTKPEEMCNRDSKQKTFMTVTQYGIPCMCANCDKRK
jgi:hypothetical protein